jgi:pimeloyl-ACP methyl ester carboxylesterase
MNGSMVRLMDALGHATFAVAGHDRGSYVALRLALDHPGVASRLVVMDGVPISEALARCDAKFARDWYHWFFFAQPDKPERPITADPDAWYAGARPDSMGVENYQEFRQAIPRQIGDGGQAQRLAVPVADGEDLQIRMGGFLDAGEPSDRLPSTMIWPR